MKKPNILCASFLSLAFCMCYADKTPTQELTDLTKPVMIPIGQQQFTLRLKANPTTGYQWFIKDYNDHLLRIVEHDFIAPPKGLMGAPGVETFTFALTTEGQKAPFMGYIHLYYGRPWEKALEMNNSQDTVVEWVSMGG
jgi:inhibitor of cysteine peptidase